jgi:hypothetical protein
MTGISFRIAKIIENEGISIRSLEQKIGCSNGVIARCIQKNTDINSIWVSKIIETIPGYNAEWLLTGKGSIFKSSAELSVEPISLLSNSELLDRLERLSGENAVLRGQIAELEKEKKSIQPARYGFVAESGDELKK